MQDCQASAYLPTNCRSEPCTPPRRPAHHRAEPQTTTTRHTRQQPALRGPVESGAIGSEPKLHLGCAAVRATAQPRAQAEDPGLTSCVGSAPVYRPCEAYRREHATSAQVIGNGSEPPTADSRTRPGRLRRRRTAGRQPGRRRRGERNMWARVYDVSSHARAQPPARAQAAADTCATGLARRRGTRNNLRGYPGRWSTRCGPPGVRRWRPETKRWFFSCHGPPPPQFVLKRALAV